MNEFVLSVWTVKGPSVNFLGFPYPTRIVVIRLTKGSDDGDGAWMWSPVAISDELAKEVESKAGTVKYIVTPEQDPPFVPEIVGRLLSRRNGVRAAGVGGAEGRGGHLIRRASRRGRDGVRERDRLRRGQGLVRVGRDQVLPQT